MTALDRAKAFINSRAVKTALKIMPLALATAAVVTITPQAKADVVLTPTSANFQGSCNTAPDGTGCSGSFAQMPGSSTSTTALPSNGGVQGASGSGTAPGKFKITSDNQDFPWDFYLNGTGSGQSFADAGIDTLTLSWNFSLPNTDPAVYVDSTSVFFTFTDGTHTNYPAVECDFTGAQTTGTCQVTGLDNANFGVFTSWAAQIELQVASTTGVGNANWDLSYLDVNANGHQSTPPGVPEPASMLLALSGLPLIGKFVRRKR